MTLENAIGRRIGPVAARLIVREPMLWAGIFIWISGRSRRDPRTFPYAALSGQGLVIAFVLGLVVLEGVIGGLLARLVPWPWLSPVLIIISAYAAIWIIGIHASLRAYPHEVTEQGALLRYGVLGEAWIAWEDVDRVVKESLASPGGEEGLLIKGDVAALAVGGKTAVTIRRSTPGTVKGFLRDTAGINQVRVAAEDPDALVAAITGALGRV
jgi:hypothetical protein